MPLQYDWISTDTIEKVYDKIITEYNGFWIVSGSPYNSMAGALKLLDMQERMQFPHWAHAVVFNKWLLNLPEMC
jgi:hypothetical protein